MNSLPIRSTIIVLALFIVTAAQGQTNDWYMAPAIVYTDDDGDRNIDDSVAGGQIAVGREMTEHLSVEGLFGYSDINGYSSASESFPGQKHLDISANLLVFTNRDQSFAPYFLLGIGYLGTDFENGDEENRPSGSLGLGFKWRMGQSNMSIRGEYRARYAWDNCSGGCDSLTDSITSLGVQIGFGGGKREPARRSGFDSDSDGVIDHWDRCPATPRGTSVDDNGCPLVGDRDGDSDGDRVGDKIDQCPNTPSGIPVDQVGCSLDSDGDGVTSDKDRCPASSPGAVVDVYGCERDDDSDGVQNHLDKCPNTKAGVRIDFNGCEIKDIIRLPGVNFQTGIDQLLLGTESILRNAAATLKKHADLQIEVAGHTDSVGQGDANYGLSERRAKTVRDYLIRYGVAADRLTARGYGESQPISDNDTSQGRAANRRVELRIVNR